jgi:hypothetical protein
MTTHQPLYRAERLPVFQNRIFRTEDEAKNCITGDIFLIEDDTTGLIANQAFRPELMNYDAEYHNEQGLSSTFQLHLKDVVGIIHRHFDGLSLIEVGCGKGQFLETLQADGFAIAGLDPTYEGSNPSIIKQYFTADANLRGDGIVLRHVLEHVQNPVGFLSKIREANGGQGRIYIEVPCMDWICGHRAWFDIFYEHVNYFRLPDFHAMFGVVYESGRIFNGQYLYIVADLATLRTPIGCNAERLQLPANFMDSLAQHAATVRSSSGTQYAIWGAASKGVIFSLFMAREGARIDMAIDINPAKQGRFLPVTGLQVQSPAAAMESLPSNTRILIMNGNYLEEIKALTNNRYSYILVDHGNV